MSQKSKPDPRVLRSRKWMQTALLELLEEKSYSQIQVVEITDRAGIARPTFYLHYKSKDELLLSYLDEIFERFYIEIEPHLYGDEIARPVGTCIFEQMAANLNLIQVILEAGADTLLMRRFQRYILRVFSRFLEIQQRTDINPQVLHLTATYLAGASLALIMYWIEAELTLLPETMGRAYYELIQPGLTNVLVTGVLDYL